MDWTLELHGSEVQWAELDESHGTLHLRFSAALVRQGRGHGRETGHVKGIELCFAEARWTAGDPALCIGTLSDSTVVIDGVPQGLIPVPFEASGSVQAEFNFRSGTMLTLSAGSVCSLAPPEPRFQAAYAC